MKIDHYLKKKGIVINIYIYFLKLENQRYSRIINYSSNDVKNLIRKRGKRRCKIDDRSHNACGRKEDGQVVRRSTCERRRVETEAED